MHIPQHIRYFSDGDYSYNTYQINIDDFVKKIKLSTIKLNSKIILLNKDIKFHRICKHNNFVSKNQ